MLTVRLKDIRNSNAKDITRYSHAELLKLQKAENGMDTIAMSFGVYGMNGGLYIGKKSGEYYKVTSRTGALWVLY